MSGTTPKRSVAPPGAMVSPVLTSSNVSRAPWAWSRSASEARYPGGGGITPMFIITGSMIIPAISPGWSRRTRRTASRRPNGTTWVRAASSGDTAECSGTAARPADGAGFGRLGVHRDLERVVVPVVAALDLDQPGPPGDGAHQVNGGEGRLGAGVGEAPQREPEAAGQLLGDGDDVRHGLGEVGAGRHTVADGGDDGRVGMAGDHHAEAVVEVDVLVAVDVPHPRSAAAVDEDRARRGVLPRRRHAAGEVGRRRGVQLVRASRARPQGRLLRRRSARRARQCPWAGGGGEGHRKSLPY